MEKSYIRRFFKNIVIFLLIFIFLTNIVVDAKSFIDEDMKEFIDRGKVGNGKFNGIGKNKNLIVLQIDSLQNTFINFKYNNQEVTPNINKLIKNSSIYFNNYYENIGKGDSGDAEFVSNNSHYPDRDAISYEKYYDNDYYGLPKYLKSNKYKTYLFANSRRNKFSRDKAYKSQGFDKYYTRDSFSGERLGYSINDRDFLKNVVEMMKKFEKDENFYAYITNGTSQKPYTIPDKYKFLEILDEHKNTKLEDYLQNIHYVDRQIGMFIEELEQSGLLNESILIIQGSSHGITAENSKLKEMMKSLIKRDYNYKEMMKVPLIIHSDELNGSFRIDNIGSHLDFYPTVANIMGYKGYSNMVAGIDIINNKESRPISIDKYKPKSYFKESRLFLMSRDGVFKNGIGKDLSKGSRISIDSLEVEYENLDEDMRKSKFLLENNLMKEIIETGSIDLKPEMNIDYIVKIDDISKKQMEAVYNKGYRYFNLDIDNFEKLSPILEEYEDIYYILKINKDNIKKLNYINKEIKSRVIIELLDEELYWSIKNRGFNYLILNLELEDIDKENEFLEKKNQILNRYNALILNKPAMESKFYKRIKDDIGIINRQYDSEMTSSLKNRKVDIIITDYKDVLNTLIEREVPNKHIVAHAGGEILGQTYTNSLEAIEKSYKEGIRLMEIDFQWTTDNKLVSTHSWDGFIKLFFNVPIKRYSYDEFINFTMINNWTQLYPENLEKWFNEYPEVYLVSDIKADNIKALKRLKDNYPFLIDKMIPQVYNLDEYLEAEKLGFNNIILTLYRAKEDDDKIVNFAKEKKPFAITMPISRVKGGLPDKLKSEGIFTYVHTINDMNKVDEMENLGITGIYTDKIIP